MKSRDIRLGISWDTSVAMGRGRWDGTPGYILTMKFLILCYFMVINTSI
jgi:hypothetical protein